MTLKLKTPPMPEPLAYWFRHINTDGEPTTQWKPVEPRNPYMNTVHDSVKELLAYRYEGKPCYEVAAVHTAEQLAARDAQWLELVGPVVEALQRLCTHKPRTSGQIDADWDNARATLRAITEEQE